MKILKTLVAAGLIWLTVLAAPQVWADTPSPAEIQDANRYLEQVQKELNLPSLSATIVTKDQVLLAKTYGQGATPDTPYIIGSNTKSITALAVMTLVEEGKIDLDAKLSTYLDNLPYGDQVTVKQLLNHTSGLDRDGDSETAKISQPQGENHYSNVGYRLLGDIIAAASGQPYGTYIEEKIFQPLGMTQSAASEKSAKAKGLITGYQNYFGLLIPASQLPSQQEWKDLSAGYISLSTRDAGRYMQLHLRQGKGIVSQDSYKEITDSTDQGFGYGIGVGHLDNGEPMLGHNGMASTFMSYFIILPESDLAVMITTNTADPLVTQSQLSNVIPETFKRLGHSGFSNRTAAKPNYWRGHLILDATYLVLLVIPAIILLRLKAWRTRLRQGKARIRRWLGLIVWHLLLPALLLSVPTVFGQLFYESPMTFSYLWDFVPDAVLVLLLAAGSLLVLGLVKLYFWWQARKTAADR